MLKAFEVGGSIVIEDQGQLGKTKYPCIFQVSYPALENEKRMSVNLPTTKFEIELDCDDVNCDGNRNHLLSFECTMIKSPIEYDDHPITADAELLKLLETSNRPTILTTIRDSIQIISR